MTTIEIDIVIAGSAASMVYVVVNLVLEWRCIPVCTFSLSAYTRIAHQRLRVMGNGHGCHDRSSIYAVCN
jgi:hypothetical protein